MGDIIREKQLADAVWLASLEYDFHNIEDQDLRSPNLGEVSKGWIFTVDRAKHMAHVIHVLPSGLWAYCIDEDRTEGGWMYFPITSIARLAVVDWTTEAPPFNKENNADEA